MKTMKKLMAVAMAFVMAMALAVPALAVDDNTISITGLEGGDNVKYYKVVEWNATSGWQFVAPFTTALSADEQKEILGYVETNSETGAKTVVEGKITDTTAGKMGKASLGDALNGEGDTLDASATSWSATDVDPGLYMALITGAAPTVSEGTTDDPMHVYNPVFLAVQADNAGSEIALPLNYPDNGTAKKTDITVDKKAKKADGTWVDTTSNNVGDVIDFKVETTVPAYLESWTDPTFTVTDSMTDGLTLAVKDGTGDAALTDITVTGATSGVLNAGTLTDTTADYSVNKTATGYTITFTNKFLQGRTVAEVVTIEYQAKITSDAATVNPETNTVTISYSNNPNDSSDHATKEDKTTHYTFSIDADLFGGEDYESSEIIKVGVDAAGNIITTTETTYDNGEKHMPLEGAEFALFKADGTTPYSNANFPANTVIVSNAEGKLMVKDADRTGIHGLAEGTYVLKETKAPTGYQLMTDTVTFVIAAEYEDVPATDTCNAYQQLASYTVTVGGNTVSSYEMDNGTVTKVKTDAQGHAGDVGYEIKNTQGQDLPSTGGIGTKIFYTMGAVLVVGAGVVLVSRKRAAE